MNNTYTFKKYYALLILFFLLSPFSFLVYSSRAEDGEREGGESYGEDRQENIPPVILAPQIIIPTPIQTPVQANTSSVKINPESVGVKTVQYVDNINLNNLKDSDQDGIPDISDKYPGEDDFAYLLVDQNNNGLADDLENLIK